MVFGHARIHPQQTASSLSKEICATLLKCINEVTEFAVQVDGDLLRFPIEWLFHVRWGKKPGKVNGKKLDFIKAGGRTTAYVPELQKLSGKQAVKETGKSAKRTATGKGVGESGSEDEPEEPKSVKGRKISSTRKPPSKKKSNSSVEHSDVPSKRKRVAKKPPAKTNLKETKNESLRCDKLEEEALLQRKSTRKVRMIVELEARMRRRTRLRS